MCAKVLQGVKTDYGETSYHGEKIWQRHFKKWNVCGYMHSILKKISWILTFGQGSNKYIKFASFYGISNLEWQGS
jgi:hypothetical protein